MLKIKNIIMHITLILIIALIVLSIIGAFKGDQAAKEFFNSLPIAGYWILFIVILIAGIITFKRLYKNPALLLIHAGCIAVLAGGLWGSAASHKYRHKLQTGDMYLVNGQITNLVYIKDSNEPIKLPFEVQLDEFRIEYYPGNLYIKSKTGKSWQLPAKANSSIELGGNLGTVRIKRVFKNFKIEIKDSNSTAYDDPSPGSNPALEVIITSADKSPKRRFIFAQHSGHIQPGTDLAMTYRSMVRDYISEIKIVKDHKIIKKKAIELNHPLHYGTYHLYQSLFGQDPYTGQMYTVISVVSDDGLYVVYSGYISLCLGIIWQLWFKRLKIKNTQEVC